MGVSVNIDMSGVKKKLSSSNIKRGRYLMASQMMSDMNEGFVPMFNGDLRDSATLSPDGSQIIWNSVYAKAQYYATNGKAVFRNYTTLGTGPYWDLKAKGIFMFNWIDVFTKGAGL